MDRNRSSERTITEQFRRNLTVPSGAGDHTSSTYKHPTELGFRALSSKINPTGKEVFFPEADLIVSKTDLKGRLTYVNQLFCSLAAFKESDLLGEPQSIVRHPDMPRCIFRLLWEQIQSGREIFAYVKNMASTGDHYWVFAHVTPSYGADGAIVGYHSNRRAPQRAVLEQTIIPLYARLIEAEQKNVNGKDAVNAGHALLMEFVQNQQVSYDELMFSLKSAA